ncbi:GAF domain-containing protein [Paucibacter sp. APW11]|uniref:GAF domain-containing protein n=1 Tax=Roseateles aquae TaxID=3077235 RepID=A0ABU3PC72_9BURK|nr:GAF domain-containing protein [Paucibacter sp. APW11]MDT9000173.1 GAF domain-containing protein [Paucibacter sp. APW11]
MNAIDQGFERHLSKLSQALQRFRGERALVAAVLALTRELGVRLAFVAERQLPQAHVLAMADRDNLQQPYFYDHERTPCRGVMLGEVVSIPCDVSLHYPAERGLDAYLGVPLPSSQGEVLGVLALMDERPLAEPAALQTLLEALAPRLAAELECVQLRRQGG